MFKFKPGDKVFIVNKVENSGDRTMNWSVYMESFLNDNKEYTVVRLYPGIEDCYDLDNGYIYLSECLSPILVKGKKIKRKQAPKIKSFKASFKKQLSKTKVIQNLCSYAILPNKGEPVYRINDICFASSRRYREGISEFVVDLTRVEHDLKNSGKGVSIKDWKPYAEYILKRSPWSSVFKYHSIGMAMRYGLPFDTNRSLSEIVSSAIALREGTEFADKLIVFNKLRKIKDISEDAAYLVSCSFSYEDKLKAFSRRAWGNGHNALTYDNDLKGLIKFFAEGFSVNKPPAKEYANEYSIFESAAKVLYKSKQQSIGDFISDNIKPEKRGEGWRTISVVEFDQLVNLAKLIDAKIAKRKAA